MKRTLKSHRTGAQAAAVGLFVLKSKKGLVLHMMPTLFWATVFDLALELYF